MTPLVPQVEMDYGRGERLSEAQRHVLRIMNDAVDALGLMTAAGACGCRTQDLSDALAGRANRYIRIDWVLALLDVCRLSFPDLRMKLARALVEWSGVDVSTGRKKTPAEELAELRETVARLAPSVLSQADSEIRGRR